MQHDPGLLVRAPNVCAFWDNDRLVAIDGTTGRAVPATLPDLRVLECATMAATPAELASRAGTTLTHVHKLRKCELLVTASSASSRWVPPEAVTQRLFRLGHALPEHDRGPMPAPVKQYTAGVRIDLSRHRDSGAPSGLTLDDVLRRRESRRRFSASPLSLRTLESVLRRSALRTAELPAPGTSRRPYPSGGGRHSLEIYVLADRVAGLRPSTYHYSVVDNSLTKVPADPGIRDLVIENSLFAMGDDCIRPPHAVLLITSVFQRIMWKYRFMTLSLANREAGCLLQTLYLVATDVGAAVCAIGAGNELAISRQLGLDPLEEGLVASLAIGVADD